MVYKLGWLCVLVSHWWCLKMLLEHCIWMWSALPPWSCCCFLIEIVRISANSVTWYWRHQSYHFYIFRFEFVFDWRINLWTCCSVINMSGAAFFKVYLQVYLKRYCRQVMWWFNYSMLSIATLLCHTARLQCVLYNRDSVCGVVIVLLSSPPKLILLYCLDGFFLHFFQLYTMILVQTIYQKIYH